MTDDAKPKPRRFGCLTLTVAAFILVMATCVYFVSGPFNDGAFRVDHEWNGTHVGAVLRIPARGFIGGRRAAIVAFTSGDEDAARVLYQSSPGELPEVPTLVSAEGSKVVYETETGRQTFDLRTLGDYPLRSDTAVNPLRVLGE